MGIEEREDKRLPPALSFKARIFVALVGISSVTSLIIGLVLYYFAQDSAPGDVNGQGVGDVWYLLSPDGEPIEESATPTS